MGCAFCASGLTKKKRDLTSGEMVAQVMYVQKELDKDNLRLSHIVVMGTGEPFDNYDNVMDFVRRIFMEVFNLDASHCVMDDYPCIISQGVVRLAYARYANETNPYYTQY